MSIFNSSNAIKNLIKGGVVVGATTTIAFGVLKWTGEDYLNNIKDQFNKVTGYYENSLFNINQYREAINDLKGQITTKDNTIADLQAQIETLQGQIEDLEANGTEAQKQKIEELQAQIEALNEELNQAVSEEDYNKVAEEVARLQSELTKANNQVEALNNEINDKMGTISPQSKTTKEAILEGNYYLTYEKTSNSKYDAIYQSSLDSCLDTIKGYNIDNNGRTDPIKLHCYSEGYSYNTTYYICTNNQALYNTLKTKDNFTLDSKGLKYKINAVNVYVVYLNDDDWKTKTSLESDNY